MGWGDCGKDSKGRNIGYVFDATCDHLGCKEKIDRGLSYVCGEMHGEDEYSCERYFCHKHKLNTVLTDQGRYVNICDECARILVESGEWHEDADEGCLARIKGE